jgi:hypothetical protein
MSLGLMLKTRRAYPFPLSSFSAYGAFARHGIRYPGHIICVSVELRNIVEYVYVVAHI